MSPETEALHALYDPLLRPPAGEHPGRAGNGRSIMLAVSTTDIDSGRGDLFVAAGLGRALQARGWQVQLVPPERWADPGTWPDVVVAMLPIFPVAAVPAGSLAVAWTRNETSTWLRTPRLASYDVVLSSSRLAAADLREVFPRGVDELALGVDTDLYEARRPGTAMSWDAATTANHWGRDRDVHTALAGLRTTHRVGWFGAARTKDAAMLRWHQGSLRLGELPELYRTSRLVVDDLNHTTLPYGSVNSRVYEALAAGALPVTNSALGLADLGLQELPVYRSAAELDAVVERSVADPAWAEDLAARLSGVVLEHHTWDARALQLEQLQDAPREPRPQPRRTLHFLPDYRITNPFQDLLYGRAQERGWQVYPLATVDDPFTTRPTAARPAADGAQEQAHWLHVHWTGPISQTARTPVEAMTKVETFKDRVRVFLAGGGKVVWTIHNVLPHECRNRYAEIDLCRFLAASATLVHVMSEATAREVAHLYPLPPEKVRLVPLTSYDGVYLDWMTRAEARERLDLRPSEIVLACVGGIRPYKGLGRFADAFEVAARRDPRLRLLVVGSPGRFAERDALLARLAATPRTVLRAEHVPDADLQVYLRAADLAVVPHERVLNSASLTTALSFGLPVLAADSPALADRLDPSYARTFGASEHSMSEAVLTAARELVNPQAREAARAAGAAWTPTHMSDRFADVLEEAERACGEGVSP